MSNKIHYFNNRNFEDPKSILVEAPDTVHAEDPDTVRVGEDSTTIEDHSTTSSASTASAPQSAWQKFKTFCSSLWTGFQTQRNNNQTQQYCRCRNRRCGSRFSMGIWMNLLAILLLLSLNEGGLLEDYPAIQWFAESTLRLTDALFGILRNAIEWALARFDASQADPANAEMFGSNVIHAFIGWARNIFGM